MDSVFYQDQIAKACNRRVFKNLIECSWRHSVNIKPVGIMLVNVRKGVASDPFLNDAELSFFTCHSAIGSVWP